MKKEMGKAYQTDDFSIFKEIKGNRSDIERRKKKIEKSVQEVGYISAPIIVNEKMQVIDGQARLAYCKETKTPITYYIVEGLAVAECIAMNKCTTNWGIMDYITSYADRGIQSYALAVKFIQNSPYSLNPTLWALSGADAGNLNEVIKDGRLDVDKEAYERGMDILEFWQKFDDIPTNRTAEFLEALGYCYLMPSVNNDTLVRKIHQRPRDFLTIATVTDAIDVIEDAYNVRARNYVYIETDYFKYLDSISKGLSASIKARRGRRA